MIALLFCICQKTVIIGTVVEEVVDMWEWTDVIFFGQV